MRKRTKKEIMIYAGAFTGVFFSIVLTFSFITIPPHEPSPAPAVVIQETTPAPVPTPSPTPIPTPSPTPEPTPEPEPEPEFFVIAMMGDCTFASAHKIRNLPGSFEDVVGDDYAYPFSLTKHLYEDADCVIINFESVMSEYDTPIAKAWNYNFNARQDYVNILHEGGIHLVSLGNNHTEDYGSQGYAETEAWLEENGIAFAPYNGRTTYTTESGLVIGMFTQRRAQVSEIPRLLEEVEALKNEGAELIIFAPHWIAEYRYRTDSSQRQTARAMIDAGVHIVMGTHPHVLQPMEEYNGGIIYYSLGNWSFGGSFDNKDSNDIKDPDTVLAKVIIMRDLDGTISVIGTDNIPCAISGDSYKNDFRPIPYEKGSDEYFRVLSKLDGSFTGADIVIDWR